MKSIFSAKKFLPKKFLPKKGENRVKPEKYNYFKVIISLCFNLFNKKEPIFRRNVWWKKHIFISTFQNGTFNWYQDFFWCFQSKVSSKNTKKSPDISEMYHFEWNLWKWYISLISGLFFRVFGRNFLIENTKESPDISEMYHFQKYLWKCVFSTKNFF